MLMKILKMLVVNKNYSKRSISKELNISEDMVEQMIVQLKNMGYVGREDNMGAQACEKPVCSCCSAKGSCGGEHNMFMNMLYVTEKGRKAVEKLSQ